MTNKTLITAISLALLSGCNNSSNSNHDSPTPPTLSPISLIEVVPVTDSERMELTLNWEHAESGRGITYDACLTTPNQPNAVCEPIQSFTDTQSGNVHIPTLKQLNESSIYIQATYNESVVKSNQVDLDTVDREDLFYIQTAEHQQQTDEVFNKLGLQSSHRAILDSGNIVITRLDDTGEQIFPLDSLIPTELSHLDQGLLKSHSELALYGMALGVKDNIVFINWVSGLISDASAFQGISLLEFNEEKGTLTSLGFLPETDFGYNANEIQQIFTVSPFQSKDFLVLHLLHDAAPTVTNHALSWDKNSNRFTVSNSSVTNVDIVNGVILSAAKQNDTGLLTYVDFASEELEFWILPEDGSPTQTVTIPKPNNLGFNALVSPRLTESTREDVVSVVFDFEAINLAGGLDADLINHVPTYAEYNYANLIGGTATPNYTYTQVPEIITTIFKRNNDWGWFNWHEGTSSYSSSTSRVFVGLQKTTPFIQLSDTPHTLEYQEIIPH